MVHLSRSVGWRLGWELIKSHLSSAESLVYYGVSGVVVLARLRKQMWLV